MHTEKENTENKLK